MAEVQLKVGDHKISLECKPDDTVFDVLMGAQDVYWGPGSSINQIKLNEEVIQDLSSEHLSSLKCAGGIIEISLSLPQGKREPKEIISDAVEYLSHLEKGFDELASKIRMNPTPEDYENLGEGMKGMAALLELLEAALQFEGITEELKDSTRDFLQQFTEQAKEMTEAQESEDHILMADIMEYELVEAAQTFKGLLQQYAQFAD